MNRKVISLEGKREARRLLQNSDEQWQKDQAKFLSQHPEYEEERDLYNALNGLYIIIGNSPECAGMTELQTLQAAHAELSSRMPGRVKRPGLTQDLSHLTAVNNDQSQPLTLIFNQGFPRSRYLSALRSAVTSVEGGFLENGIESEDDVTLRRGDWEDFIAKVGSESCLTPVSP